MKEIKLYFAGAWCGSCSIEEADLGITNKLVSFIYPDQLRSWFEVSEGREGNIIVDSGAFSAWNKGKPVDLDAYINYALTAIEKGKSQGKRVHIVNLDVIPGKAGQTASLNRPKDSQDFVRVKAIKDEAARQGYHNLKRMKEAGITPIHVFHQGEDYKWIERMVKLTPYIGISPANDMSVKEKAAWIGDVFRYLWEKGIEVDTHGFAVWMPSVMKAYPWTSCDAATWRLLAAWGCIMWPPGGLVPEAMWLKPATISVSMQQKKPKKGEKPKSGFFTSDELQMPCAGTVHLSPAIMQQIEAAGFTFEDLQTWEGRARINVKYFLGLEKHLNEYKRVTEFNPATLTLKDTELQ
jgi:hypothetical protein